jgi:O-antigen biosynthesis protein WbqP
MKIKKNMTSRIIAILMVLLLSPVLIIVALIIFWDDKFPILFKQRRVGINNSIFWVYKFRTMKNGTPDIPTHLMKAQNSLYLKTGPFFRKYSIDELPQLFNIVRGEMLFVGPRPALHNQADLIELRSEVGLHKMMPGVTGWAQINGRDDLSIPEKVSYDEYYLRNVTPWFDLKVVMKTVLKVFGRHGVSH